MLQFWDLTDGCLIWTVVLPPLHTFPRMPSSSSSLQIKSRAPPSLNLLLHCNSSRYHTHCDATKASFLRVKCLDQSTCVVVFWERRGWEEKKKMCMCLQIEGKYMLQVQVQSAFLLLTTAVSQLQPQLPFTPPTPTHSHGLGWWRWSLSCALTTGLTVTCSISMVISTTSPQVHYL